MPKLFFVFTSLAAIAGAFVVSHTNGDVTNSTRVGKATVKGLGIVTLPIARKYDKKGRRKRQSADGLRNDVSGYSIQIGIGTPPQLVDVQIDTGSSELWVNPTCSNAWNPPGCSQNGYYTPASSSTKLLTSDAFSIQYGIGSASGLYVLDNVAVGSAKIVAQQFGDASISTDQMEGIMGIGWGYGLDTNYYNVIDQLALQGITHSRAFSVDLASIDVAQGSIIFGGIDTMKYSGVLEKRPIIPYYQAPDFYPRYWIYMTSLGVTIPGSSSSIPVTSTTLNQAIFPDSGSTFCYLPPALFAGLLSFFPSAVNQGSNEYTVPCSLRTQAGTIDFGFGGTTIHVSYHEFFWFDGAECWLAAVPSTEFFLLGDSFMRSAYIVYDQDNANVLLAQAANCGTNITQINSGPNAVPSIIGGCTPPQPTSSSSSIARTSTFLTSLSSSAKSSSTSSKPTSTSSNTSTSWNSVQSSTSKSTSTSPSSSSSRPLTQLSSSSSPLTTSTSYRSSSAYSSPNSPSSLKPAASSSSSNSSLKNSISSPLSSSSLKPSSTSSSYSSISSCGCTATVMVIVTSVSTAQAYGTCTTIS